VTIAPSAINELNSTLLSRTDRPASYAFLGIVGDANHSFGYHLSPNQLRANGKPGDYSLILPRDVAGARSFPDDASAWDLGFSDADMVKVTNRLLTAAKAHDPRMAPVREFCGTTDNVNTHPYDLSDGAEGPLNSWDSSHLHHVHLSFYRDASNNYTALSHVLDVICGTKPASATTAPTQEDDDMIYLFRAKDTSKACIIGPAGIVYTDDETVGAAQKVTGRPIQTDLEAYLTRCADELVKAIVK
jgi:hypothetical protein